LSTSEGSRIGNMEGAVNGHTVKVGGKTRQELFFEKASAML